MKRTRSLLIVVILMIQTGTLFSDETKTYHLPDIPHSFQGIYIPESYISSLVETENHYQAMRSVENDIPNLIVSKNRIDFLANYHESAAINLAWFRAYSFSEDSVLDNFGETFIKIGNLAEDAFDNRFEILQKKASLYLLSRLFGTKRYFQNGSSSLEITESGTIIYNNDEYQVNLDTVFANPNVLNLRGGIGIEITDIAVIVHELIPWGNGLGYKGETEIVCTFSF